jgi:hypothetical protein
MKENSKVQSHSGQVAAQLTQAGVREAFGRLDFKDDPAIHEHVDSLHADHLALEHHRYPEFGLDVQAFSTQHFVERTAIDRFHISESQLTVHLVHPGDDLVAQLLFDDPGHTFG